MQVCYKCGAEIADDYPSHFCRRCRGNFIDYVTQVDPIAALKERLTDWDRMLLWTAGIKLDAGLMNIIATMTCPRCKEQAHKDRTEDSFRCGCGWDSNTKVTFSLERDEASESKFR